MNEAICIKLLFNLERDDMMTYCHDKIVNKILFDCRKHKSFVNCNMIVMLKTIFLSYYYVIVFSGLYNL